MGKSMDEATNRGDGNLATELPSNYLPAVEYRDLPDPRGLRKCLGASVILTAIAIGSGELIRWPEIVSQVGIALVGLPVLGITLQFFLNMEIERYTLVTGETAVTGFSRLWLGWGIVFILAAILPNTLPGYAFFGGWLFTINFGLGANAVPIVTTIFLIAVALSLTLTPMTYQVFEKIQAGFNAAQLGGKRISLDGDLPVNPHGGQLSEGRTHGYGFIYEAMAQLREEAGERQVASARTALVTSGGGTPSGVLLLQRDGV